MAQLKDLIVNGASRIIGPLFVSSVQTDTLKAPTSSNGTTFGPGSNGQVLKSNGTKVYWGTDDNRAYTAGTGLTLSGTEFSVSKANASTIINQLDTGSSTPADADYYVSQYVSGGTTTTSYHRRPMSALWEYIKGKISSVLGLTATSYGGKAATAGNADTVNNKTVATSVPANAVFTDTNTWRGIQNNLTSDSTTDSLSAAQGKELKRQIDLKTSNTGTVTSVNNVSPVNGNVTLTIPSAVTESTVSGWGFTKNTGTYSKPSTGIPKTDLASAVQTSLGKADTALQSHQDISGKQDNLVSGTNIKTINNQSILGSGNIDIGGEALAEEFTPKNAAKGNISNSWVSEDDASLTLSPGTWIITSHAYYRAYTTYSGSTNSSAGVRRVRTGYSYVFSANSGNVKGSVNTSYATASTVCGVTSTSIRTITEAVTYYPEVYSANQVGLDSVRIEAVRIA